MYWPWLKEGVTTEILGQSVAGELWLDSTLVMLPCIDQVMKSGIIRLEIHLAPIKAGTSKDCSSCNDILQSGEFGINVTHCLSYRKDFSPRSDHQRGWTRTQSVRTQFCVRCREANGLCNELGIEATVRPHDSGTPTGLCRRIHFRPSAA